MQAAKYESFEIPDIDTRITDGATANSDLDDSAPMFSAPRPGDPVPVDTGTETKITNIEPTDNRTIVVEPTDNTSASAITIEALTDFFEGHGPLLDVPVSKEDGKWNVVFEDPSDQDGLMKWIKCSAGDGKLSINGLKVTIQSMSDDVKRESAAAITAGGV